MFKRIIVATAIVLSTFTGIASGSIIIFEDDFSYADGDLTSVSGGTWRNHSGTADFVQVSSGAVVLAQGAGSREDVNVDLGAVMGAGDIWRYEFDVSISGGSPVTPVYFSHFKDASTGGASRFNSRLFVAAPTAGGDFTFGIDENSGSTPGATFNRAFNFGTTYRVFAEYNFDLGTTDLWVDSLASGVITSATADIAQPMSQFALRQAGGNTTMTIDNLIVTAVPEPSSLMLVGLVGTVLALRRRR